MALHTKSENLKTNTHFNRLMMRNYQFTSFFSNQALIENFFSSSFVNLMHLKINESHQYKITHFYN